MVKDTVKEGIPSLFVLTSPLQVLCAIEAIAKFNIKKYKMILVLPDGDKRNDQVFYICKLYDLVYEVFSDSVGFFSKIKFFFSIGKYKRAFIGDVRNISQLFISMKYVSLNASYIFLDDGTDSIYLFKYGYSSIPQVKKRIYIRIIKIGCILRKTTFGRDFFTLYDDINNANFNIIPNRLEIISKSFNTAKNGQRNVFYLGTNYSFYCNSDNYPIEMVTEGLRKALSQIKSKYLNERIIYVPHGRDNASFPIKICNELGIEIIRPKSTIELMLMDCDTIPVAVYGFTSTALYNIKLLFPSTEVYNVVFHVNHMNPFIKQMTIVSDYYREHEIVELDL